MKWIVGLGNPEPRYFLTPHNIGWMVVDRLREEALSGSQGGQAVEWRKSTKAPDYLYHFCPIEGEKVLLLKPLTYMNLSGRAVRAALHFYKLSLDHLLVIQDDTDLPFLSLKFQSNRGPAGHNGIKSLHTELASPCYARLRIGMQPLKAPAGKTPGTTPPLSPAAEKRDVLKPFSKEERQLLEDDFLSLTVKAVKHFVREGVHKTASRF